MSSLTKFGDRWFSERSKEECLADPKMRISYGELLLYINGTSRNIEKLGLQKNDRVALHMENGVLYVIVWLALTKLGVIVVPVDIHMSDENLEYILSDSDASKIIQSDLTLDENKYDSVHVASIVESMESAPGYLEMMDEDIACINYTTGTTSHPKGVILSHGNVYASLRNISRYMGYDQFSRELVALPLTHSFGLNQVLVNLKNGGFAFILNGFSRIGLVLKCMKKERITAFPGTPTSYRLFTRDLLQRFKDASASLKTILINSSPLPETDARFLLDQFPDTRLVVYYGLTEASRSTFHTHSLKLDEKYLSSVGRPAPNVEVRIMDEEGGLLPADIPGEVVVKADTVMRGYLNLPLETQKAMVDGWFRTGDLGYLDSQGYLFLTGRIKDQLNVGGLKFPAREVSDAIEGIEGVVECFVFGTDDDLLGEVPAACIVTRVKLNSADVLEQLESKLERHKIPRKIYFLDSIPKSATGKILKYEVEKLSDRMECNA